MDGAKENKSLIMKGRREKSCVGSEVDLFCSPLFILREHNTDHPSFILSVIIIDLVSTFFNLLPFCLSSCPQSCHESQSSMEGWINKGRFGWCLSLWDSLGWYIRLWRKPMRNFIHLTIEDAFLWPTWDSELWNVLFFQ